VKGRDVIGANLDQTAVGIALRFIFWFHIAERFDMKAVNQFHAISVVLI
jgi:hypothetical protein